MIKKIFFNIFLILFVLVACSKYNSPTIGVAKVSKENTKFYLLGLNDDSDIIHSKIYKINSTPNENKDFEISLYKSSVNMDNWDYVNSTNISLKGENLINADIDKKN